MIQIGAFSCQNIQEDFLAIGRVQIVEAVVIFGLPDFRFYFSITNQSKILTMWVKVFVYFLKKYFFMFYVLQNQMFIYRTNGDVGNPHLSHTNACGSYRR